MVSATTYTSAFKEMAAISQSTLAKTAEWDSLVWVRDNTPADSKILIFFGLYGQGFDINSERISTPYPHDETLIYQVFNQTMPTEYKSTFRLSLLSKESRFKILNKDFSTEYLWYNRTKADEPKKLTDFDYVLARYKGTQVDPCVGFYITELQKQGHQVVWYDDYIAIIKVNKDASGS